MGDVPETSTEQGSDGPPQAGAPEPTSAEPEAPVTSAASAAVPPVPVAAPSTWCANHLDRRAIGRCPTCGKLVCDECHVRLDGILHCKACLQAEARKLERPAGRQVLPRVATSLAAAATVALALFAVRAALTSAGFFGGRATRWFAVAFEESGRDGR